MKIIKDFMLVLLLGLGITHNCYAASSPATPKTVTAPAMVSVVAVYTGKGNPPTAKSINSGQTYILVGTAAPSTDNTKTTCCKDQAGMSRVVVDNFAKLSVYDIDGNGTIDGNEAGYYGLFAAKVLPDGNYITSRLKDIGIKNILLPKDKTSTAAPLVEFSDKTKVPLVVIQIPATS